MLHSPSNENGFLPFRRNPVNSDSEGVIVDEPSQYPRDRFISALLASGFRPKNNSDTVFVPCPLGTFIDPSTKGEGECQNCPPGKSNFLYPACEM